MPYRLPRREDSGAILPRLRIKRMVAPISETVAKLADIFICPILRNIDSMRRVTAKPPNILTAVSAMPATASQRIQTSGRLVKLAQQSKWRRDLHQRANGDDAADRIGHAHQGGMQGRRDIPDHHVTDETREHEHSEVPKERCRRIGTDEQEQQRGDPEQDCRLPGRCRSAAMAVRRRWNSFHGSSRLGGGRRQLRCRSRPGDFAVLDHSQAADRVVFHVDVDCAVLGLAQLLGQTEQIGCIQRGRLLGQTDYSRRCNRRWSRRASRPPCRARSARNCRPAPPPCQR